MLTYSGLVSILVGLDVEGVNRTYSSPPTVETSGNYPIMFPQLPTGEVAALTVAPRAGLRTLTAGLVIVSERDTLGTGSSRFTDTVELMDALDSALAAEMESQGIIDGWVIMPEPTEFGWAIIATVEASG